MAIAAQILRGMSPTKTESLEAGDAERVLPDLGNGLLWLSANSWKSRRFAVAR
jgi:hypothetical protein